MSRVSIRELSLGLIFTVVISVLYRFWLNYPVLQTLTITKWNSLAVLAAAVLGIASGLAGLRAHFVMSATFVGLVLGGASAGLSAPHDVATTFFAQLAGHLEVFWREVVLFTVVTTASSLFCTYMLQKKRKPT